MHTTNQYLTNKDVKTSNRLQKINQKFKNIQNNFLNQTVNFIIEKCNEHNVGTVVLGYNKNFQFKSNIGKKQNQYILTHSIQTIQTKTKNMMPKYMK